MDHFAGLDGLVKETSVWIAHDTGKIVRQVKVASVAWEALLAVSSPTPVITSSGLDWKPGHCLNGCSVLLK